MTTAESLMMIGACAFATFFVRWLPFGLFPANKPTPKVVIYLGKVLPYAITGMLVVYCLAEVSVVKYPYGIPELIGVGIVVLSYKIWKNSLVSIAVGTILYMILLQLVFI